MNLSRGWYITLRILLAIVFLGGLLNMVGVLVYDIWMDWLDVQKWFSIGLLGVSMGVLAVIWRIEWALNNSWLSFAFLMGGSTLLCFSILVLPVVFLMVDQSYLHNSLLVYITLLVVLLIHSPIFALNHSRNKIQRVSLFFSGFLAAVMFLVLISGWNVGFSPGTEWTLIGLFFAFFLLDWGAVFFINRVYQSVSEFTAQAKKSSEKSEETRSEDDSEEETEPDSSEAILNIDPEKITQKSGSQDKGEADQEGN